VREIISKYLVKLPAVGHELESFCRQLDDKGVRVDFTERSLGILDRVVRSAARGERSALKDTANAHSFMVRNRHIIGGVGTFLGCLVIENIGGLWEREEGGLLVGRIGRANMQFDPFQAVIKAIINPRKESLTAQYSQIKGEKDGTGPRVSFRDRVLAAMKSRISGVRVGRVSGFDVWLTNGTRVHIGNLYTTCAASPENADEAIQAFVEAVAGLDAESTELPCFKEASAHLFPVLKNRGFLEKPLGNGIRISGQLVWEEFLCGLVVCFVFDGGGCYRFVRNEDLGQWSAGVEELRWHALANLEKLTRHLEHDCTETRHGRVIVINANDGYDAARILLPGLRSALSEHLGEVFVSAVPCRDLLVAFENKKKLIALMKQWVRDDAHLSAYGLTDSLFMCGPDGTRPLNG
jgi:uncharacterized protein YtpQ (UPF0354 family)